MKKLSGMYVLQEVWYNWKNAVLNVNIYYWGGIIEKIESKKYVSYNPLIICLNQNQIHMLIYEMKLFQ